VLRAKRDIAAACAKACGITELPGRLRVRPVLVVPTYHRIGNADQCPYDPWTFSATCDQLDEQVR
jgi:hypothetical protein